MLLIYVRTLLQYLNKSCIHLRTWYLYTLQWDGTTKPEWGEDAWREICAVLELLTISKHECCLNDLCLQMDFKQTRWGGHNIHTGLTPWFIWYMWYVNNPLHLCIKQVPINDNGHIWIKQEMEGNIFLFLWCTYTYVYVHTYLHRVVINSHYCKQRNLEEH